MSDIPVINLDDYRRMDAIATFILYRDHRGKHNLVVVDADPKFIESHTSISERFEALEESCMEGTEFLGEQAKEWKAQGQ